MMFRSRLLYQSNSQTGILVHTGPAQCEVESRIVHQILAQCPSIMLTIVQLVKTVSSNNACDVVGARGVMLPMATRRISGTWKTNGVLVLTGVTIVGCVISGRSGRLAAGCANRTQSGTEARQSGHLVSSSRSFGEPPIFRRKHWRIRPDMTALTSG